MNSDMKKLILLTTILLSLSSLCTGQRNTKSVTEIIQDLKKMSDNLPPRNKPITILFDIGISSHGDYPIAGKSYFIVYPDTDDTTQVSNQAAYIEKLFKVQGTQRIYNKELADFIVNVRFNYERDVDRVFSGENSASIKMRERYADRSPGHVRRNEVNSSIPPYDNYPGRDQYVSVENQNQGFSRTRYNANYILSLIIEGHDKNDELLFVTVVSEFRRIPSSTTILPFLCFSALGLVGIEAEEAMQLRNDNPMYFKWLKDSLSSDNMVSYPAYASSSNKIKPVFVIKDPGRTTIVLRDKLNPNLYEKMTAFLKCDNLEIPVSKSYLSLRGVNNNSPAFTIWEFPVDSENADELDIVFYNKKRKEKLSVRNIKLPKDTVSVSL